MCSCLTAAAHTVDVLQTIDERDALEKEEAEAAIRHKHRLEDRKVRPPPSPSLFSTMFSAAYVCHLFAAAMHAHSCWEPVARFSEES